MGDDSFCGLCLNGDIEGVQAAIDNGADVNEEDDLFGKTGLMWAFYRNHNNVVQLLLNQPQIDVNKVDQQGRSVLDWALNLDNHEGLAALLARHDVLATSINQRDRSGYVPIVTAACWNSVKCFHLLLTHPLVDLDTRDGYERTPQEVRG